MIGRALAVGAALLSGAGVAPAQAPVDLSAHYSVSMTYVTIGELSWATHFNENSYLTAANGKASGMFSVLFSGEGSISARGARVNGRLTPREVTTTVNDDDERFTLDMVLEAGAVKAINDHGPKPPPGRKPVTPEMMRGVADPLTAMLIPAGGDAFAAANCDRTLKVFDGRRRYDLALSFKRTDAIKVKRGYEGRVLVCNVVLNPVAGYRPDSRLVQYLAGKSDLEIWYAPVSGTAVIAPVRAVMPTIVGTLELLADEFQAGPRAARNAPAKKPAP
jgi:hypothetical protein